MKKVVFFICLFLMSVTEVNASSVSCNSGHISFEKIREGYVFGEHIVKTGSNPFEVELLDEETSYFLNGFYCSAEQYIGYGYSIDSNRESVIDGLIVFIELDGTISSINEIDYGESEEVKNIYFVDNTFFVEVVKQVDNGVFDFQNTIIEFYDSEFLMMGYEVLDERIIDYVISNQSILFNFDYDNQYDVGFSSNGSIFYDDSLLDIKESYQDEAEIIFMNEALLNGETVSNGVVLDYPGYYTFMYKKLEYSFVVEPSISGVEDKGIYDSEVRILFDKGNATLNGESYISNEVIVRPGLYVFKLEGVNDYLKELTFTIKPEVEGVINGQEFNEKAVISFSGEGYLNNNLVTSPVVVEQEGDYMLRILGENGYSENYEFIVKKDDSGKTFDNIVSNLDIVLVVIVVVAGVIIIKKK